MVILTATSARPPDPEASTSAQSIRAAWHALKPVVCMDGGAGSGKSSVSIKLSVSLGGVPLLDSGRWYRAVAFMALARDVPLDDEQRITELTKSLSFVLDPDLQNAMAVVFSSPGATIERRVISISDLENPEVAEGASIIGKYAVVRQVLKGAQLASATGGLITPGRAQGAEVFDPTFEQETGQPVIRILLYAPAEVRATRRFEQLYGRPPAPGELQETLDAVRSRDDRDSRRAAYPLLSPEEATRAGYVVINTANYNENEVVALITDVLRDRVPQLFAGTSRSS